ncbi:hypothetical protein [Dickeya solani]|nr:hypothetical protein [Dickeya solani]MDV6996239.1 hypothetical protein [Dickeya solani]MDV7005366.1 hypothetical protein [Dickeya solani]MDV7037594.1 hypothetical protein [Dickeya solani]
MNAYQIYDAAIENAENNDIEISAKYFSVEKFSRKNLCLRRKFPR